MMMMKTAPVTAMSVAHLNKLRDALEILRGLHPAITVNQALVFVLIVVNPGITQRQIMEQSGLSDSSTSRIIDILGKWGNRGTEGLLLIDAKESESDRRTKEYSLTAKGRAIVDKLVAALGRGR